ncbi:MAG: LamG domain-containing protein [archaeon]
MYFRPSSRAQSAVETIIVLAFGLFILTYLTSVVYNQIEISTISQHVEQGRVVAISLANAVNDAYFLGPGTVKNLAINLPDGIDFNKSSIVGREITLNISGREIIVPTKVDVRGEWPREGEGVFVITVFNDFVAISSQPLLFSPAQINRELLQGTSFDSNLVITNIGLDNSSYDFSISTIGGVSATTTISSPLVISSGGEVVMPFHISCPSDAYGSYSGTITFSPSDLSDASLSVPLNITCSPAESSIVLLPSTKTFSVLGESITNQNILLCNNSSNSYVINSPIISGAISSFAFTSFSGNLSANSCVDLNLLVKAPAYGSVNNYLGTITATVGNFTASADLNMIVTQTSSATISSWFSSVSQNSINPNNASSAFVYKNTDLNAYLATGELDWNTSDTGSEVYFDGLESYFDGNESYFDGNELQNTNTLFDSSLVGLWHLNDKNSSGFVLNSVTGVRDGNLNGGADVNATGLWDTNSLNLSGSNQYSVISPAPNISGNFSISAWVYVRSIPTTSVLIERGVYGATDEYSFVLSATLTNGISFQCNNSFFYSGRAFPLNRWVHIVGTLSGTSGKYYEDGVLVSSGTLTAPISGTDVLNIGYRPGSGFYLNGKLEDISIWNRSLSSTEISSLYSSQAGKYVKPNMLGLWHLNDKNSSGWLLNSASNVRDANLNGGADTTAVGVWDTNAISLNGTSGYAQFSNSSLNNITSKTISFWTYLNNYNGPDTIGAHWLNKGDLWFVATDLTNNRIIFGQNFAGPSYNRWSIPITAVPLKTWVHIVITYNNSSASNAPVWYVNGLSQTVTQYQSASGAVLDDSAYPLYLAHSYAYPRYIDGKMEELTIWNRTLSSTEVSSLYYSQAGKYVKPDLIALYNLNGNANDSISSSNNGVFTDSNYSLGLWGTQAGQFDGVNDFVDGHDNSFFDGSIQQSIFFWVKGNAQSNKYPLGKFDYGANQRSWMFRGSTTDASGGKLGVGVYSSGTVSPTKYYETSKLVFDNYWHQVGMVWNSGVLKVYVDGVEDSSVNKVADDAFTTIYAGTAKLTIGAIYNSGVASNYFTGLIDEVSIWNRALTASEISLIYSSQSGQFYKPRLIASWDLNGNAFDSSGNRNNGTYADNNYSSGLWDSQAAQFDGTDSYVDIPNTVIPSTTDFTISTWINSYNASKYQHIIQSYRDSSGDGRFTHNISANAIQLFYGHTSGNTLLSFTGISSNKWYFTTVTRSGNTLSLYVNGAFVSSGVMSNSTILVENQAIGNAPSDSSYALRNFFGKIEKVSVWNRALSAHEINAIYISQKGNWVDTNLVAYYKFNEKFDTNKVLDSARGNNGTITGSADVNAIGLWDSNALGLNGTTGYVNMSPTNLAGRNVFTISFWAKSSSYQTNPLAILLGVGTGSDATKSLALYSHDNANGNGIRVWYNGASIINENGVNRLNSWDLYTFVSYSSTNQVFYVNGVSVGSSIVSKTLDGGLNLSTIGGYAGSVSQYFNGSIDELKIYDRALSQAEIQSEYSRFLSAKLVDSNIVDATSTADWNSLRVNHDVGFSFGKEIEDWNKLKLVGINELGSSIDSNYLFDSNLIALYHLNDKNASGYVLNSATGSRDTSLSGGVDVTASGLWDTNAGIFGGTNGYMNSSVQLSTVTKFSISAWVKSNAGALNKGVAGWWDGSNGIFLQSKYDSGDGLLFVAGSNTSFGQVTYPTTGKWVHVVGVYDGSLTGDTNRIKLYANGVLQTLSMYGGAIPSSITSNSTLKIGNVQSFSRYWAGSIDEVAIWNRALNSNEVSDLYSSQKPMYQNGLVGLWHLNDKNSSGWLLNSATGVRDGSLVGGADVNAVGLWDTNALYLDGINDYFEVADKDVYSFGNGTSDLPFSVSTWLKMYNANGFRAIGKIDNTTNGAEWLMGTSSVGNYGVFLYSGGSSSSNLFVTSDLNASVDTNTWAHIVVTYDGSKSGLGIKIYRNGLLLSSSITTNGTYAALANTTAPLRVGIAWPNSPAYTSFAKGVIEEPAIWNRALSASEVNELYRKGVSKLDLNVYSCSDANCTTRTGSQYISDANNGSWMDLNSSLPNSQYLGIDAFFKPGKNFTDQNAGTFWVGSYLKDFNVLYTK